MKNDLSRDSSILPWSTLDSKEIADCRIFTVECFRRQSTLSGRIGDFCRICCTDWVNVVALTQHNKLVMVRQFRHATDEITLEIPGGIIDLGESPLLAAQRELREETGYIGTEFQVIGRVRSNPAIITNWTYTVLITGVYPVGELELDDYEEIEVELHPVESIGHLLRSGEVTHALVVDALMFYKLYTEEKWEK